MSITKGFELAKSKIQPYTDFQRDLNRVGFEPTPEDRRTTAGTPLDAQATSLRRRLRPLGHLSLGYVVSPEPQSPGKLLVDLFE
ncbi:hypothetical protein PGTUg99_010545 [Puccinia graminis f. sp. tritici]|uniref:Uncharacterized protein n=1 Tax=Puccinia graminis f. sp. tritici TaxID=56615 RepID=A0A5B0LZ31_PUCGR|nr:hypothetical protein PGTUg99_010545 [Puccinia graminis f. sp. tritici]